MKCFSQFIYLYEIIYQTVFILNKYKTIYERRVILARKFLNIFIHSIIDKLFISTQLHQLIITCSYFESECLFFELI